jgi:hypothetical protein
MAAGGQLTSLAEWLDQNTVGAPPVLARRVRHYVSTVEADASIASTLATAATTALDTVARQPEGRAGALDLLAADALITLALLAQSGSDPSRLHEFATRILHAEIARA